MMDKTDIDADDYSVPKEERELRALHSVLQSAFDALTKTALYVRSGSFDTAFSVGETMGFIAKAKALVGRDLDDLLAQADTQDPGQPAA